MIEITLNLELHEVERVLDALAAQPGNEAISLAIVQQRNDAWISMNESYAHIAGELEGAGWPDEADALRGGDSLDAVIARLRDEHYPPDDLIEWLEGERA